MASQPYSSTHQQNDVRYEPLDENDTENGTSQQFLTQSAPDDPGKNKKSQGSRKHRYNSLSPYELLEETCSKRPYLDERFFTPDLNNVVEESIPTAIFVCQKKW